MNAAPNPRHLILAVTGASGAAYAVRLLEALLKSGSRVDLIVSPAGRQVLAHELGLTYAVEQAAASLAPRLGGAPTEGLTAYAESDFFTPPASGSSRREAMIVCPCSMGSAGRFAHGVGNGLIERSFQVSLKERRRILLVPRETPLSAVDLDNLAALARLGVDVVPAMPGFYHQPRSVQDLIDFVVARVLNLLGIPQEWLAPWHEPSR